jgi:hypothetical protein
MPLDTAAALAALTLVLLWPIHQQLEIRALRHSLRRQRDQLHQHRRAIVQLQAHAHEVSVGQPMPTIRPRPQKRPPRPLTAPTAPDTPQERQEGANGGGKQAASGTDHTVRLQRPPVPSDVESVLQRSGRALTATEIATKLGRQTWDLIAEIDQAIAAGKIVTVPSHIAGRTAYQLADTTTQRIPNGMSVLPGVTR